MNDQYLSFDCYSDIFSDTKTLVFVVGAIVSILITVPVYRKIIAPWYANEDRRAYWEYIGAKVSPIPITITVFLLGFVLFTCPILMLVRKDIVNEITINNAHECVTSVRVCQTHDEDFTSDGAMIYNESDSVLVLWLSRNNEFIGLIQPKQHEYIPYKPEKYIGDPYDSPMLITQSVYIGYEATYDSILAYDKLWKSELLRKAAPPERVFNSK